LASTRFCDRIILIDDKRIAETGTHEELLAFGGKYAELFNIQSKYYREGVEDNGCV
jgi:ATP-binding cassette subfamily B protein